MKEPSSLAETLGRALFYALVGIAGALVVVIVALGFGQLVALAIGDPNWRIFVGIALLAWALLIAATWATAED